MDSSAFVPGRGLASFAVVCVLTGLAGLGCGQVLDGPPEVRRKALPLEVSPPERVSLLVRLEPRADRAPLTRWLTGLGARVAYAYTLVPDLVAVRDVPSVDVPRLVSVPGVLAVLPDRRESASLNASVAEMKATPKMLGDAGVAADGEGVTVCIVATGIDAKHSCFPKGVVVAQKDFVADDGVAGDDNGHGTHVAGIVACRKPQYRGVAPGATLAVAKVLGADGSGSSSDILAGIDWCVSQAGATVINLSLGGGASMGDCGDDPEAQALDAAAALGVVPVVASGNEARKNQVSHPACAPRAIAVGAVYDVAMPPQELSVCTDPTPVAGKVACFSNGSPTLDVVAPGAAITSAAPGGGWATMSGTSMAAPHVAGLVALMRSQEPALSVEDVRRRLWSLSTDAGAKGFDDRYGHGRVDAVKALTKGATITCTVDSDCASGGACSLPRCQGGFCTTAPACDDHDACTKEACTAGGCAVTALAIDDGLAGTADSCDACTGPTHTPTSAGCGDTCAGAAQLHVGQTVSGNTKGRAKDYSNRCASGWTQPGPDVAYRVTLKAREHVRIRVTPTASWDPSVYVLAATKSGSTCTVKRCLAGVDLDGDGQESLDGFTAPADGDYFVIVDTWSKDGGGPFSLAIEPMCFPDEVGRPCDDHDGCTDKDTCQVGGSCVGTTPWWNSP